jgi:hypothetical protein
MPPTYLIHTIMHAYVQFLLNLERAQHKHLGIIMFNNFYRILIQLWPGLLLVCSLLLYSPLTQAQLPVRQWDKCFGGSEGEAISSVIQTREGGYLLAGYSDSGIGGDRTQESRGYTDYWVVKTDLMGNKLWDKRFGGDNIEHLISAIETSDSGYLLAGESYSGIGGDKSEEVRGEGLDTNGNIISDYWVVKTDLVGNKLWDKTFGGNIYEELISVLETSDGGYFTHKWGQV